jgi:hypothetical protein
MCVCIYVCIHIRTNDVGVVIQVVAIGTDLYFVSTQTKTLIPASRHLYAEVRVALSRRGIPVLSTLSHVRLLQVYVRSVWVIINQRLPILYLCDPLVTNGT